eukprot:TRINITY_DN9760_c0_g3_i2.p1 TRINITY_DN9760_c0_g3~~TRINITY_DN9760_c0_g3_i2.p1  ORF type:complete len:249 (+),score=55.55 TRINITY_DN9760_c0_g3_i2:240-986(+)
MVIVIFILILVAVASSTDNGDYIKKLDAAENIQENSNLISCMKGIIYSSTTGAKFLDKYLLKSCYVIDPLKEIASHGDNLDMQKLLKLLSLFISSSKGIFLIGDGDMMKRFIDGIVKGVKELKTPADLMKCVKDSRKAISQLKQSMENIRTTTPAGIETGCQLLLKGMKEIFSMLGSCLNGYRVLIRLRDRVNAGDPKQMQKVMINSLGKYYQLAEDATKGFMYNNYEQAGLKIGMMLELLFLSQIVL